MCMITARLTLPAQVFIESFQRALAKGDENTEVAELSWFGIG